MEECKKRHSGTKVSKIANIFQGMPSKEEEEEMRGADVTVVRTESHLTRFNNARALFEKLGEENRGFRIEKSPSAAASFAGTRGAPPIAPARSRSSSAGSVSPPRRIVTPTPLPPPNINGDRLANGAGQPPPKPMKPSVLPKPEKPDRRFNKELIEKQRNWTAHFNKTRQVRNDVETKVDSNKYSHSERKSPEAAERYVVPSRVYSPPSSPCAGDTQIERPTTLPSALISRNVSGTKSPSPVQSGAPVSPTSRPTSIPSPIIKPEPFVSPSTRRDMSSPRTSTVEASLRSTESNERLHYKSRSTASPMTERESNEEVDNVASRELKSPHAISKALDRISPVPQSPPPLAPIKLEPDITQRSKKSPSPPTRIPRSPITPKEDLITTQREASVSPLPKELSQRTEKRTLSQVEDKVEASPSPSNQSSQPQEEVKNENANTEVEVSEYYEIVSSKPKTFSNSDDDAYENVQYSDEWDDKVKRRSSTPESPASTAKMDEITRSPLASPLASPVHPSVPSSPPPHQTSPSPGKYIF